MKQVQSTLLASGKQLPITKLCAWLGLPRSTAYHQPRQRRPKPMDQAMVARIRRIHKEEPACGVRGTWSRLRYEQGIPVNIKKVRRILVLEYS